MTRSPKSGNEEPYSRRNPRLWLLLLGRTSLVVGVISLVGIAGGVWWVRNFVYKELAPLVQSNLQQLLGRPVQLGKVERFSLNSLRFGALSIPATATDSDRVAAKAVEVQFSPLRLLVTRTLELNVTLVQPDVYIQQDKQSRWVTTQLKSEEGRGFVQTELKTLRLTDGDVVLDPTPRPGRPSGTVALDRVNGTAQILSQNQGVNYQINAQPSRGGTVQIDGQTELKTLASNLKVLAQNFEAADLSRLIELPIILQAGRVDGDLAVRLQFQPEIEIFVTGTANANQVTAQVQNVPQKFTNANGRLTFQGQQISLENLSANYGKAPLVANGAINLQTGFNVSAQVKAVSAKNALDTLKVNSPVPVAGDFQANIKLTGPIQQPTLTGTASTIKAAQVDRVLFNAISTGFQLTVSPTTSQLNISNLRLIPAAGGQIVGQGQAKLGKQSDLKFDIQAEGVSADTLATSYGFTPPITVGNVSANAQVTGSLNKLPLTVTLSNVQATPPAGGKITANGQIQLAPQGEVALNVELQGLPGNAIAQGYGVNVPVNIGGISANAKVTGTLETPLVDVSSIQATPEVGGQITANGQLQLSPQGRISFNVQAENLPVDAIAKAYNTSPPITIGNVSANAKIGGSLGNLRTVAQISAPTATYPTTGRAIVSQQGQNILFQDVIANIAGGTVRARGQLRQDRWQAFVNTQQIQLNRFQQIPPEVRGVLSGVLNSQLNLSGTTASIQPSTIQATGQANISGIAGGSVNIRDISLNNGRWQAAANVSQVQLSRFEQIPPQVRSGVLSSRLNLSGTTASIQPSSIQATGQANISAIAGGSVNIRDISLNNGRWQAAANISQVQLSRFEQIPPQVRSGVFSSRLNLSGTTASIQPSSIQATGQANISAIAGGSVNIRDISLNNGRWQALANASQIQLNRFSDQLQGRLSTNIQVAGNTQSFQLGDIRAAGQVRLSQIAVLEQPLTAQIQWNGQQIVIERATAPGLNASGTIALNVPETGTPQISNFNLDVRAQGYNLGQTPVKLPNNIAVAGLLDFQGQVTGTPNTPQAQGDIRLRNFKISNLAFDPVLSGKVNFQGGQGGELQLAGQKDAIAVNLGSDYRPTSFLVRLDQAVATGKTEGDNLLVNVQNFPVAIAESFLPNNPNIKPLAGQISGDLTVNLNQYTAVGDVAIAKPRVGRVTADGFTGNISYANGAASLNNGKVSIGGSDISVSGNLQTGNNPQFQLAANFNQLNIQSFLQAVNVFGFQDLSGGLQGPKLAGEEVLQTESVRLPNADLLTQLKYFSDIAASVNKQQTQREQASTIPTLEELRGALSGEIKAAGSLQSGLNADFNFQGSNWQWGEYNIQEVLAIGTFADGVVTLLPVRVGLDRALLAFTGQVGTEQLSGQVRVSDLPLSLPVSLLKPYLERFPVDVAGQVDATATLAGSLKNPSAIGELTLENATLNQQEVQTGELSFNYNNARLNFASTVLVTGTQPLQAQGSVPVDLPFASVKPDSDRVNVTANIANEGFGLLNLFTDQVAWVNGEGQLNVEVGGTLDQLTLRGNATVNNATLQTQALPKPLTNVTGTVQFNGSSVFVESVQGQYDNQGNLTATGIIPIFANQQAQQQAAANPLTVSLQNLDLTVQNLYEGGVSGNAIVGGSVLKPDISGEIQLSDGQVTIGQTANTSQSTGNSTGDATGQANTNTQTITVPRTDNSTGDASGQTDPNTQTITAPSTGSSTNAVPPALANSPIEFTNLRLILGDNVRVTTQPLLGFVPGAASLTQPILRFDAQGDLTINGTLGKPSPQGTIRLTGGEVNLFTTQFTLERGYEQTAQFTPSRGLDPVLDVRLIAFVPETSRGKILASPTLSADVSYIYDTTSVGTLRTVRVRARADGPASQLADNLELSSEPARSEAEIVALLGGSIINTFGQSDAAVGIATFAGSSVLGGLQGSISAIGQAIGFSEFRIFPTSVVRSDDNGDETSGVLGLAAEGAFDITGNLSVSLSQVFLTNGPFRYGLLYRVNDNALVRLVRGSTTDSEGERQIENRIEFEYEARF